MPHYRDVFGPQTPSQNRQTGLIRVANQPTSTPIAYLYSRGLSTQSHPNRVPTRGLPSAPVRLSPVWGLRSLSLEGTRYSQGGQATRRSPWGPLRTSPSSHVRGLLPVRMASGQPRAPDRAAARTRCSGPVAGCCRWWATSLGGSGQAGDV